MTPQEVLARALLREDATREVPHLAAALVEERGTGTEKVNVSNYGIYPAWALEEATRMLRAAIQRPDVPTKETS